MYVGDGLRVSRRDQLADEQRIAGRQLEGVAAERVVGASHPLPNQRADRRPRERRKLQHRRARIRQQRRQQPFRA
jgi:hypothetical protein